MLTFEILLSCMHLGNEDIVKKSNIVSDTLVVNQCDENGYREKITNGKTTRIFSLTDRGLTKSRNFAIAHSCADVCLVCDDDESFKKGYERKILRAYEKIKDADVIIFKIGNQPVKFPDKVKRLGYFDIMHVSSWQISFRRKSLIEKGIGFDEKMGAGTGNGAEEEFRFLRDCLKAGLKIYYVPVDIADVAQSSSTWFKGYNEEFFVNRGNTTRYIMGFLPSLMYAFYYCFRKKKDIEKNISWKKAFVFTCKGIFENRLGQNKN